MKMSSNSNLSEDVSESSSAIVKCGYCDIDQLELLARCSRCQNAFYCSKEHQKSHWKKHKKFCLPSQTTSQLINNSVNNPSKKSPTSSDQNITDPSQANDNGMMEVEIKQGEILRNVDLVLQSDIETTHNTDDINFQQQQQQHPQPQQSKKPLKRNSKKQFNGKGSIPSNNSEKVKNEDSENYEPSNVPMNGGLNITSKIVTSSTVTNSVSTVSQNIKNPSIMEGNPSKNQHKRKSNLTSSSLTPYIHKNNLKLHNNSLQWDKFWLIEVCQQMIKDMSNYGFCVLDNLLGEERGDLILNEVLNLYSSGTFKDGKVVKELKENSTGKLIRSDMTTWVDGREPNCQTMGFLISLIDSIVMGANNIKNNGPLGNVKIRERTKAMVSVYPGSGSHYVKHVDNPNNDGRCITSIYYLNRDWDTKENGGLLRIYPEGSNSHQADIEPLFDRVIFFWSDRRNPHAVLPSNRHRYAITCWYFDSKEREEARKRGKDFKVESET